VVAHIQPVQVAQALIHIAQQTLAIKIFAEILVQQEPNAVAPAHHVAEVVGVARLALAARV